MPVSYRRTRAEAPCASWSAATTLRTSIQRPLTGVMPSSKGKPHPLAYHTVALCAPRASATGRQHGGEGRVPVAAAAIMQRHNRRRRRLGRRFLRGVGRTAASPASGWPHDPYRLGSPHTPGESGRRGPVAACTCVWRVDRWHETQSFIPRASSFTGREGPSRQGHLAEAAPRWRVR